ncbi:3'(2'),5'-bisphosphate nucleotidase CysQ family protein [Peterkaempfera bronchialis]|uniref:Inositol monophosphatase family protein n=1 Tax=Peterkaempfera bronchialis TaxID=2126346 RepID=A0A345SSW3_9ACTN|nr:inositol monophosphatase family protein [Peterkaempfera bronchialis]AXI76818.1 inositol monophosphatase family protein [Peterkaempfera bronchialis]
MSVEPLWSSLTQQLLRTFADYRNRLADLPIEFKADRTLLTRADVEIQDLIVREIRRLDPNAVIIAEEDERTGPREEVAKSDGRVWVIDPIDGTAEFVRHDRVEFCSVVCLLEDWKPSAALVVAPELGTGRTPLVVTGDVTAGTVRLGGGSVPAPEPAEWVSVTRSLGSPARSFEAIAKQAGYRLKTRTTSQTLDMVRTVVDLSAVTDPVLPRFDLFWRRTQKLWDGAAGLCLGAALGLRSMGENGEPLPYGPEFLSAPTPAFPSTVMGRPETVAWFLEVSRA